MTGQGTNPFPNLVQSLLLFSIADGEEGLVLQYGNITYFRLTMGTHMIPFGSPKVAVEILAYLVNGPDKSGIVIQESNGAVSKNQKAFVGCRTCI